VRQLQDSILGKKIEIQTRRIDMQKTINECVGCADGCCGCGADRTPATVCDSCGAVCSDGIYHSPYSNDDLCINCAVDRACKDFNNLHDKDKLDLIGYKED
jgi:hypothetical protein